MAIVNFKNLPSEETPLTGGTNGNLNVMQENGTSHGADTKLGYAQSFLNDHIINVSNEVDEDYRVNLLETKNLCSGYNQNLYINSGVNQATIVSGNTGLYIKTNGGKYTISTETSQTIYRVGCVSNIPSSSSQTLYNGVNKDGTSDNITIDTAGYDYLCITCTDLTKIQIEEGSTATTYEAFVPNEINVNGTKYSDTLNVGAFEDSRSRVNVLKSNNIFDEGTITGDTTSIVYHPVAVKQNTNYTLSTNSGSSTLANVFLTLQPSGASTANNGAMVNSPRTINSGTNSVIYVGTRSNLSSYWIMLNEGSTALPYEPYITPSIYVDNEEIYNKDNIEQYSNGEIRIGTWIDGKPLYRRVISFTLGSSGGDTIGNITNVNDFINIYGLVKTGNYYTPLVYWSNTLKILMQGNKSTGDITASYGTNFNGATIKAIVEYTKTTD